MLSRICSVFLVGYGNDYYFVDFYIGIIVMFWDDQVLLCGVCWSLVFVIFVICVVVYVGLGFCGVDSYLREWYVVFY